MTPREEALADMRYAKSLGETALKQHYIIWRNPVKTRDCEEDKEYQLAILEINAKLNTPECLLEK